MENGGREGNREALFRMHHAEVGFLELFLIAQGQLMGITLKAAGQKRMDNSAEENERHCQVETAGLLVAFTKHLVQAGIRRHRIVMIERNGKMAVLGFPPRFRGRISGSRRAGRSFTGGSPQEKSGGSYGSEQTRTVRQNFEEMTNTAHVCRQTKRLSFLSRAENESACFLAITHSNGKIQTCPGKNARGTEQAVMPA